MRVTTVLRQSKSGGDDRGTPEEQEAIIRRTLPEGWSVVASHAERSTSGGKALSERPGLLAAVAEIEGGLADVLAVSHSDRLDRNLEVRREVCRRIEAAGGVVWTPAGRISFGNARDKLQNTMQGAMEEHYKDVIREKVADNKAARIAEGKLIGRLPQLGYRSVPAPDGRGRVAEVIEEHREIVLRVFRAWTDGQRDAEILSTLAEAGHSFSATALRSMIESPIYKGCVAWNGEEHPGAHEGIVSERLWRRAQEMRRPRGARPRSQRLLAGLRVLTCPDCGRALVVGSGNGKHGPIETYTHPSNVACRASGAVNAEEAERVILAAVGMAIRDLEGHAEGAVGPAMKALGAAREHRARLVKVAMVAGDDDGALAAVEEATREVERLTREVEDARAVSGVTWKVTATYHGRHPGADDWREEPEFEGLSREDLRELISTVVESATVRRNALGERAPVAERIAITIRDRFDVGRILDTAAAGAAELLARPDDYEGGRVVPLRRTA